MLKLIHAFDMNTKNVYEYYKSFNNEKNDINCYAITLINNPYEYYNYVKRYENNLFYLVDSENENYIIGFGTINEEIYNNNHVVIDTGNIGYGIRPSERNKGYCKELLKLLLRVCEELGMRKVYICCLKENTASNKVILNNNGKLNKEYMDCFNKQIGLKYCIKVKPKIKNEIKRIKKKIKNI